jgi:serine-type D-Ala-D-Ala carboxypeptidase (penicillin-binding protein 5/6)
MTPIAVPRASDTTVSTRCTVKNPVGWPAAAQERGSSQMLCRKFGQITQDHTAKASRNSDVPRESLTRAVSAVATVDHRRGVASLPSVPLTARRSTIAFVLSLCALVAATVAPAAAATARPRQATDAVSAAGAPAPNCPDQQAPPPAVDTSEQPPPGVRGPSPLPIPEQPVGGPRMGECGFVLPGGVKPVPNALFGSWVLADLDSGAVLAAKDPHARLRPASLIKVLLGLVVVRELKPDMVVTAIDEDARQEGTRVGLVPGVPYTVDQLLHGLVMGSGNDVAHALARQLGGVPRTLNKMNTLAKQLGALDTRAATPSGLDGPGMSTSAYDIAVIFRAAMQNREFADAVATRRIDLPGVPGKPPFALYNDNPLLTSYAGDMGGKTGYTDDANHTYVNAAQHGADRLFMVGMNGNMHPVSAMYTQAKPLMDYAFELKAGNTAPVGQLIDRGMAESGAASAAGEDSGGLPAGTHPGNQMSKAFGNVGGPLTAVAGVFLVLVLVMWWRRRRARRARAKLARSNAERPTEVIPTQAP